MCALDRLVARPIAHRGLHVLQDGLVENTSSAFEAAIAAGYGIECDLQITADGEAVVHHDPVLGRLTDGSARIAALTTAELKQIAFKSSGDRMITLGELCDLVAGRAAMLIELKSGFDGDQRLVRRAAEVLVGYAGPAAVMSFDPGQVAALRRCAPRLPRGIVAESQYRPVDWAQLPQGLRRSMTYFAHALRTRPQFVAFAVKDLPAAIPWFARQMFRLPILTWTVRSFEEWQRASHFADQMIFEGFRP
ncbi:MAG: glycerophosphodiester phosphodiesterase family protein [Xanthobacteraceae bacterium]